MNIIIRQSTNVRTLSGVLISSQSFNLGSIGLKIFLGGLWVQIKKIADYYKFKPPRSDFTASDWSREVFGFEGDTDVEERRRKAQNSSIDSNIPKKLKKNFDQKSGRLGIFGVKCQNSSRPYNMRLIWKLWTQFLCSLFLSVFWDPRAFEWAPYFTVKRTFDI